jgi:hypothetical protein
MPARSLVPITSTLFVATLVGCDTSKPLRMEAVLDLKGPITMEVRGPSVSYEGTYVSDGLYELVEEGVTSETWIVAAFGEPDRRVELEDGSALLVWEYNLTAVEGSGLNIVDFGDEGKPAKLTTLAHVANAIVIKKWRG